MRNKELDTIKSQLLNSAIKWVMILLLPGLILESFKLYKIGIHSVIIYIPIVSIFLIMGYFIRNKVLNKAHIYVYSGFFFILGISLLVVYGIFGSGLLFIVLALVFSLLIFYKKTIYRFIIFTIVCLLLLFFLFTQDFLLSNYENTDFLRLVTLWLITIPTIILILLIPFFSNDKIYKFLFDIQEELDQKNKYIAELNFKLEREKKNKLNIEQAFKRNKKKYRTLFEKVNNGIMIYEDGKLIDCNQKVLDLLDVDRSEVIGKSFDFFSTRNQAKGQKTKDITKIEKNQIFEWTVKRKNGDTSYLEININNISEKDEKHRLLGLLRDITEQKKAEQAIINSERKFENIFNSVFDAIFIFDINGNILEINDVAIYLLGYPREEFLKKNARDIIEEELLEVLEKNKNTIIDGEFGFYEVNYITKSGKAIPLEITTTKIKYNENEAIINVGRNITQRKQMQRDIFRAMIESEERERERYAKELHDGLGPILSTCKIYFHTIKVMPYGPMLKEHVKRAGELLEDALQGIKEISNNLSPHILRNYGLIEALYSFVDKIESVVDTRITIGSNFDSRLPDIIESTIYRTLVELINNSLKYSESKIIQIKFIKENDNLIISYKDDGKGFDYNKMKKQRKGFGLLNLENRIKEIGGEYNFKSSLGKGVLVNITLKHLDLWLK